MRFNWTLRFSPQVIVFLLTLLAAIPPLRGAIVSGTHWWWNKTYAQVEYVMDEARPNDGWTPSIARTEGPTQAPDSVSPLSPHENDKGAKNASIASNEWLRACQSARSDPEIPRLTESSFVPQMKTSCDGSR